MELYIIRHAQSTNNATQIEDLNNRVSDPPLTDLGHQQAQALARFFRDGFNPDRIVDGLNTQQADARQHYGYPLDQLYCSPMHRSLQTTKYLVEATGLTPKVWVQIHEHGGIFLEHIDERGIVGYPGKTRKEITEEFPGYVLTDDITEQGWWTGAMEDITAAHGRAIKVALDLHDKAKSEPNARVGLVSHGTFIGALIKALTNHLPSRSQWYWHYNTAFSRVDIEASGLVHIRYLNRVQHLTPQLIS